MPLPKSAMGCPMDALLRVLMGPWTTYILWVLRSNGPTRFGALKRLVAGISAKVLTERLRALEAAEIIERRYVTTIPPQVTYAMAPRGLELAPVLDRLNDLAKRWMEADGAAPAAGCDKARAPGAPARARETVDAD
jgi:DNA-binding HxlR family transcriptional regulator